MVSNGIGGYAASGISGLNESRYHGLLVASLNPPADRRLFVSRLEEQVIVGGQTFDLNTNQYPGKLYPEGYQHLVSFSRKPLPVQTFQFGASQLSKRIFMPHGQNTTLVSYRNESDHPLDVRVRPQFVDRDFHTLFHRHDHFYFPIAFFDCMFQIRASNEAVPVFFRHEGGTFVQSRAWYTRQEYLQDFRRGQDYEEDTFSPGYIRYQLAPGQEVHIVMSLDEAALRTDPEEALARELKRLKALVPTAVKNPFIRDLITAGDAFLVHRESTGADTILAGYPWFTDWGRDAMIAMRGLTIALGEQDESRAIFQTFLSYLDQGMLPNRFPDRGEDPEYNTVDATLWLFVALHDYVNAFDDWAYIEKVMPQLREILDAYIGGTRFNIHLTKEGFVFAGSRNTQLTWMDARVWGYAITPRWGCPVEINALWYNALCIYERFAKKLKTDASLYREWASRFKANFKQHFLNYSGYLNDLLVPNDWKNDAIRPNQVYALSLPFPLLTKQEGKKVMEIVRQHLFTPYGLRTLSPGHPDYRGTYEGDAWSRDNAYHQGTVWPFLLGEYYQALFWLNGTSPATKQAVEAELSPLIDHFYQDGCIHGISEIFDGLNPETGKGTWHQAWSVSALIKLAADYELFGMPPLRPEAKKAPKADVAKE